VKTTFGEEGRIQVPLAPIRRKRVLKANCHEDDILHARLPIASEIQACTRRSLMEEHFATSDEVINRLIKLCHQNKESAEKLYQEIIVEGKRNIQLPDGPVILSQSQAEEFAEHFSSEVGPEIWISKSGKY
jgi:hypothetical protein